MNNQADEYLAHAKALMDSAILEISVREKSFRGDLMRLLVRELQLNPDWNSSPEARKRFADNIKDKMEALAA